MFDPANLLARAQALFSMKRYAEAEKELINLLGIDPRHTDVMLLLCECKLKLGKLQECLGCAETLLGIDPNRADAFSLMAEAHALLGNIDRAVGLSAAALGREPRNPDFMAQYAQYKILAGDEPAAVQLTMNALKVFPEHVPSLAVLGLAKFRLENYDEALEAFHRGLALEPTEPMLLHLIGKVLAETQHAGGARSMFLDALRQDPNMQEAALSMAQLDAGKNFLYRLHYRMVRLYKDSHISRLSFFAGLFIGGQSIAEQLWIDYPFLTKGANLVGWFFLLILLSVFIVPVAGRVIVIFKTQYKHLFSTFQVWRIMMVLLFYMASWGLLVTALMADHPAARTLMYFAYLSLVACMLVSVIGWRKMPLRGWAYAFLLILFICTHLWLVAFGIMGFGHGYTLYLLPVSGLLGGLFHPFRQIQED